MVALARRHAGGTSPGRYFLRPREVVELREELATIRVRCRKRASTSTSLRVAADWLLDNDFLLRRVYGQLQRELPAGFQRRLPILLESGQPRTLEVANALFQASPRDLELEGLERLLSAYQRVIPLTIAELWALPTLIRFVILSKLRESLRGAGTGTASDADETYGFEAGRAIRALRLLAEVPWTKVFARQSATEHILLRDPAEAYAKMDFDTCDTYRRTVEEMARASGQPEIEVAAEALAIAESFTLGDRRHHVGYHLVGRGRRALERRLGARRTTLDRHILDHPRLVLFALLGLANVLLVTPVVAYLIWLGASPAMYVIALTLSCVPASVPAASAVRQFLARVIRPRALPSLDFSKGIPEAWRTLVAVPVLLGSRQQIDSVVQQLELHYLANPDPQLRFALLTDHPDSDDPPFPVDGEDDQADRLAHASEHIERLNGRYGSTGLEPFQLLHREHRWNAGERKWMGWERKRGKLDELNRYLRGDSETTHSLVAGDSAALQGIAFVLTLDSDTQLPAGAAARLVGTLAHPLNRPDFGAGGRVVDGYTVLQPRVEISPRSAGRSAFSRLFSGDTGIDIYTRAVSETYQDLFGEGIYVGKGIYDIDAFHRALSGRVPENSLLSHDLFEGVHGRAALVTDVVVYEDYPSHVPAYLRRLHRWIRGDWQLLPWLLPRVPVAAGGKGTNRLSVIDRFKIFDNLRRSLIWPAIVALLAAGWLFLPGHPLFWTLAALVASGAGSVSMWLHRGRRSRLEAGRWLLAISLAPQQAVVTLDAIVRVLIRMAWTRKNLLEWTTAEEGDESREGAGRARYLTDLWAGPTLAVAIAIASALVSAPALPFAAPVLLLWLASPEIGWRISRRREELAATLDDESVRRLRLVARRTWMFFQTFVGPSDNWLPIDHYQEDPRGLAAHRTSPTNMGMLLTSQLAAYDLGYLGREGLASWTSKTLDAVERLERIRGHVLNWYDTRTLEPLEPRYVSTVDSGNLAGALLTLAVGCEDIAIEAPSPQRLCGGIGDTAELLVVALEQWVVIPRRFSTGALAAPAAHREARALVELLTAGGDANAGTLVEAGARAKVIEAHVLQSLRDQQGEPHEASVLREIRMWLGALLQQVADATRELETDGWVRTGTDEPEIAATTRIRLREVARRSRALVESMDFAFLYDEERRLLRIGYNASADRLDTHHYDLLASEARLASFLAVVRGEVPLEHWFTLGRPLMPGSRHSRTLLSWGGSMFEYLMPRLFMRSHPHTLLSESYRGSVDRQIEYGLESGTPWGISESGYALLDGQQQYQYRAFGVPGLALRHHLEGDVVVAPYASLLALSIRPRAVMRNLEALIGLEALGRFGFYEALDFHPDRALDRKPAVVRSYMAHHHGMSLVAIANLLTDDRMVSRFHRDPTIRSGEMLLDERIPPEAPAEQPARVVEATIESGAAAPASVTWAPAGVPGEVWGVGNGSLTSFVTTDGGGGLRRREVAISRWEPDTVVERTCRRTYLVDLVSGEELGFGLEVAGRDPHVVCDPGQIELRHRTRDLAIRLSITVTSGVDVEIQEIEISNEGPTARSLRVVGCLEPVLAPWREDARHPAFSKLFLRCTPLPSLAGALVTRLGHNRDNAPQMVFRMLGEERTEPRLMTIDRADFIGRNGTVRRPAALDHPPPLAEGTLDPLCAAYTDLTVAPGARAVVSLITAVANTGSEAIELTRQFASASSVRWAFEDAQRSAARRVERLGGSPERLPATQRLLHALLVPDEAHRAPPRVLSEGRPSAPKLWGRGISGDEPIVVLNLDRTEPGHLLADVLAAHRYIRHLGIPFDIVVVDRASTTYSDTGVEELKSMLAHHNSEALLQQRGGVHVVSADQASEGELIDLWAAARVYLDSNRGSFVEQMGPRAERPAELPPFAALGPPRPSDGVVDPPMDVPCLEFDNGFGGFDGDEYVVRPGALPPAPWCNVIANQNFGCLVSEASMGSTWCVNAGENRLTPWHNDPVLDTPSEVLYLRDEETGHVWSTTPLPSGPPTLVRHGQGFSEYRSRSAGVEQRMTVFVPPDDTVKIVKLELSNTSGRPRRLTATYYAEWVLGTVRGETRAYIRPDVSTPDSCLLAETSWSEHFAGRVAFLATDQVLHGYTTDRSEMLGQGGSLENPAGLRRWGLSGRVRAGLDPCAALQIHVDLEADEVVTVSFFLGQGDNREGALDLVRRLRRTGAVDQEWAACGAFWERLLGSVHFRTPDPALNRLGNRWLPYQTLSSRFFGRTGSYQSSGAYGFRDQLQDSLLLIHSDAALTRRHLLECAAHQFTEGDVLHWWHPPSGAGVRTRCSDDLLWLPYVTCHYVTATGDTDVLFERVPFLEGDPISPIQPSRFANFTQGTEDGTLLEHCRRALERGFTSGPHGLPLIGDGDWNDGMDAVGVGGLGESIWLGWFVHDCVDAFARVLAGIGLLEEAQEWRERLPALRTALHHQGWDGGWYRRAYYDDGTAIGSAQSEPPHIDSIAQSWAALSGAGDPAYVRKAIAAAERELVREDERLVLLLTPPFSEARDHDPGYIAAYPPGVRENGGQYTHAGVWLGMAHAALGDGRSAHRIASLLNPLERTRSRTEVELYRVEPYVVAADIYGMPPFVGRGGWTWYTGSGAWLWRLIVESILGLRRRDGALHVDPCLPPDWDGFEAQVRSGGISVKVIVHNDGCGRGVTRSVLDGRDLERPRVDLGRAGHHVLEVWLGVAPPLSE